MSANAFTGYAEGGSVKHDIFTEISGLPIRSQIVLAAQILRDTRPSVQQLADAAMVDYNTVRGWLNIRPSRGKHA